MKHPFAVEEVGGHNLVSKSTEVSPMGKSSFASIYLLSVGVFAAIWLQARVEGAAEDFIIDSNSPFVYYRFDHIGKGMPGDEEEAATRIWLRLTNNCGVPIVVSTFGVPPGSPKDEEGVMYEVVPTVVGPVPVMIGNEQQPSPELKAEDMPKGYMFDVGSSESIHPGESVLFSVPMNHFGNRWQIEIPFQFDLPKGKGLRDPNLWGGQPKTVLEYSLYDLPPKYQTEVEMK